MKVRLYKTVRLLICILGLSAGVIMAAANEFERLNLADQIKAKTLDSSELEPRIPLRGKISTDIGVSGGFSLKAGTEVIILSREEAWYRVRHQGVEHRIHGSLIEITQSTTAVIPPTVNSADDLTPKATEIEVSTNLSGYNDDFTDKTSGWLIHRAKTGLRGADDGASRQNPDYKYNLFYKAGQYRINIPLDYRCASQQGVSGDTRHIYPVVLAPVNLDSKDYLRIETAGNFVDSDPWHSFWGLVFAATEDKSLVYSLEVNNLGNWAVVRRSGYSFPGPNHPWMNEQRDYLVPYLDQNHERKPARPTAGGNLLAAEINGAQVKLFINGQMVHQFEEPEICDLKRAGIIGGSWEITPTDIGIDYFKLEFQP